MKALTKSQIKNKGNDQLIESLVLAVFASRTLSDGKVLKCQLSDARNLLNELAARGIITKDDADRMYGEFTD